ncbi:tetratricopeptide repeat protein [Fulvivirgaceae bacterium BMA10]|uniref:Tetratricopeptide repeat protein n=1 Tax=Splendidivirga corallicola TaxID=3051826 RepID=A0ABT8KQZ6_9BACT|nr:tetratricopeptide repeat protein [Fulvivirgaceae bacterium BMA10]
MRVIISIFLILLCLNSAQAFNDNDYANTSADNEEDSLKMNMLLKLSREQRTRDPERALELGEELLDLARENQDKANEIKALENLGRIFYNIGNYDRTLEYFFQGLRIVEKTGDKSKLAGTLNNIGVVYAENKQLEKALEYYQKSLELKEEIGKKGTVAISLSNIGLLYDEMGKHNEAYSRHKKALEIDTELQNVGGLFASLNNLGENFLHRMDYDSALHYFNRSLEIGKEIDDSYNKAHLLNNLAKIHLIRDNLEYSLQFYEQAVNVAREIGARAKVKESYLGLSDVYEKKGDVTKALFYFRAYEALKDSLFNEENTRKITEIEANYKLQEREEELNSVRSRQQISELKLARNRLVGYLLISCLMMFSILIFVLYKRNQFKIKSNLKLERQNKEISNKNMDIMDSIAYAKSIQEAFLPDRATLGKFFDESFIYYKARDVINGDFYWFDDEEDYLIFAVVDCTGHGVPGALITVMGNSIMNQVISEQRILYPADILSELNDRVLNTLNQGDYNMNNSDGMDMAVCRFDKGSMKLTFAGAKRPIYYFSEGKLQMIKGDSHSVGGTFYPKNRLYQEHEIYLNKGDTVYVLTDGYTDQFGGEHNKKFLSKRFKDLLHEMQGKSMTEQEEVINRKMRYWKGEVDQTDDILVMGLKV